MSIWIAVKWTTLRCISKRMHLWTEMPQNFAIGDTSDSAIPRTCSQLTLIFWRCHSAFLGIQSLRVLSKGGRGLVRLYSCRQKPWCGATPAMQPSWKSRSSRPSRMAARPTVNVHSITGGECTGAYMRALLIFDNRGFLFTTAACGFDRTHQARCRRPSAQWVL